MNKHVFRDDLAFADSQDLEPFWRSIFQRAFPNMLNCMSTTGKNEAQKAGSDWLVVLANNRSHPIEAKLRRQYYPDILLEYRSSEASPGWIERDLQCHFLAYAFRDVDLAYLFPWHLLRRTWLQYREEWLALAEDGRWGFRKVPANNGSYVTWNIAVPRDKLFAAIEEVTLNTYRVIVVGKEPASFVAVPQAILSVPLPASLSTAEQRIAAVCVREPKAVSDNRYLIAAEWDLEGLNLTRQQWATIERLTQPETIRRTSRKMFNEKGLFVPAKAAPVLAPLPIQGSLKL